MKIITQSFFRCIFSLFLVSIAFFSNAQKEHIYKLTYTLQENSIEVVDLTPIEIPLMSSIEEVQHISNQKWILRGTENGEKKSQLFSLDFEEQKYEEVTSLEDGISTFSTLQDSIYFILNSEPHKIYRLDKDKVIPVVNSEHKIKSFTALPQGFYIINDKNELHSLFKNNRSEMLGDKAGTCLEPFTSEAYTYIYSFNSEYWYLKKFLPKVHDSRIIIKMPQSIKEYTTLSPNLFISHDGSALTSYRVDRDVSWKELPVELPPYKECKWIVTDGNGTILFNIVE